MNIVDKVKLAGGSLVLVACVLAIPVVAGEYYRWTGPDGVVHYGSTPPKGVDAELVKTYGGGASSSSQAQEPSTDSTNNTANATEAPVKLTPEQMEAKKKRCTEEKERLAVLSKPGRIRMNMPDGTTKYLSEEDIAREIKTSKKVIEDSCQ